MEESAVSAEPQPFLKWAGGKRWLVSKLPALVAPTDGRYLEPFLGSGAIFFSARPRRAVLADVNSALIEAYRVVRDKPEELERLLRVHDAAHGELYYYEIRSLTPSTEVERAAQFIYLNRTCWNGLYRVNRKGEFNVPKGTKKRAVLETDDWAALSAALSGAQLLVRDFGETIALAGQGDVVFADPPYTVKHNLNGFIKYNQSLFSWDDQIRLRDSLLAAKQRGAKIWATNADHESVRALYRVGFHTKAITRASVLSGDPAYRGRFNELLICSEPWA
ncbi:MAG: dpnM [Ramlibacter sp.]|jgi:DNA adenine methylase|nr:dpnM [Ramlibacter sp.]